ncbi:T9SS type A sorting domain-containing protein [Lacinutrix sp. Hel_I_90]|uniref:T9SS type A sorting domain-containing protein n=1 Tax=Lacinutrix sp. Hel_I_90 TaxID=1249999 RepID=UPI0005CB3FD0|nr:T9SS type A sorting domain-containing protein [Lacinutrix sp. Hel_I_90]
MKLKATLTFLLLLMILTINAQNFIEKQLPSPNNLSSFFIGSLLTSTIHYGEKPSNFNGEVLLFNHGYIDLNQLFFTGNTFYKEAYNAGYHVVFVGTTRGEGLWANGKLLAESIDIITKKYTVNALTIIAHSNGGKAAEVAMFTYNKKDKVKKVFALGTPFWGTYLADISQQWWFNWIWNQTGLNEGAATSTTYYCRDVVRPYFDNLNTNQPEKFFILGASGFKHGHTIIAPLMFTSGSILYLTQGTNDGVTSYRSSLRPEGYYLFNKGEARLDHADLAFGQYVWPHIKPYLEGTINKTQFQKVNTKLENEISSNYQIINSDNSYDKVVLNKPLETIKIEVFHEKKDAEFILLSGNNKLIKTSKSSHLPQYNSSYTINNTNGSFSLNGNSRFAAFVHFTEGPKMNYKAQKENETITISFENTKIPNEEIEVDAIISKTSNLYGEKLKNESFVYPLTYNSGSNSFSLDTSNFDEGVYSLYITGKHSEFVRSIVSGFTVGSLSIKQVNDDIVKSDSKEIEIALKYNVIKDKIELINTSTNSIEKIRIAVYNLNGEKLIEEDLTENNRLFLIKSGVINLAKGLYIITVEKDNLRKSFKIIKK